MHPEALSYMLSALWSINERLGGGKGEDYEPFDSNILLDAYRVVQMEADALEDEEDDYGDVPDPLQWHKWGLHGAY